MEVITDYKYYISPKSGKRAKFKIGFLTTTLSAPQGTVSDRDIKKNLLEPYLRKLKKYGLKNYIWKAELQNNGNLHFHIFLDCYIDKTDARNIWNRLQSKFHFITAFEAKHGHRDPNSTDIRPVNTNSSMTRYMLKYMIKPVEKGNQLEIGRPAEKSDFGKVWDCSRPLKEKNNTAQFVTNEDFEHVERAIDQGFLKEVKKDFATIYYINNRKLWQYLPSHLIDPYYNYLKFVKELRA
jgi:hypothetical protein